MAKILGTCSLDTCTTNGGMILLGDAFDIVPVKYAGKQVNDMFHRECNPYADHTQDDAA